MVICERIAGVGSKCKGLDCPTTPCTGLGCENLTKVNQTCHGVTSDGVKCINGSGIIEPDALDIFIKMLHSCGTSLDRYMLEHSLFICPDKVKEQMDDLMNLLRNLNQPDQSNNYIKRSNSKLPVRYSASLMKSKGIFVDYYDVHGEPLVFHDCREGFSVTSKIKAFTKITSKITGVTTNYSGIPIVIDPNNNNFVQTAIGKYTGVAIGKGTGNSIHNYIVSHIWARTYDPFYFSSLWNVAIIPAHCNDIMDKGMNTHPIIPVIKELYKAICYKLYGPNKYLTDIENILKQNYPNIQIPRVEIPESADLQKAQTYIDNGLIFI